MTGRRVLAGLLSALFVLLAAGCGSRFASGGELRGRILVWHSWSATEASLLDQVINSFVDLNPGVTVMRRAFADEAELRGQFAVSVASGLGPDLLLVPADWSRDLAREDLIAPIDGQVDADVLARYASAALALLRHDERLYGLPESLDTLALYYNRRLVTTPAATLDDLLAQATAGATVLLPTNFYDAFWGIQAFGGRLFDESGRTILEQGGFANWLAWLRDARAAPGMIQDASRSVLRNRFLEGNDRYYVGYASELDEILEALGAANAGVALLPSGPLDAAAPLLNSRAFVFSDVSSAHQRRIALELAKFVTNQEQSARLMRAAYHAPANMRVRINARLNPFVAVFATQACGAVAAASRPEFSAAQTVGGEAYIRVLEGGESPADVAFDVANAINTANGFDTADAPAVEETPSPTMPP